MQESFARAGQLASGEGEKGNDLHASGQGLGQTRQGHNIGGTGQQKPPRAPVPVHRELDGREQIGHLLDFINDNRAGEAADEPGGVSGGERQCGGVVEREVLGAGRRGDGMGQCRLAGLTCAAEQHDGSVGERFTNLIFHISPNHGSIFTTLW